MKKIGIYKLTSPSGKIYIGQSTNLYKRLYCYNNNCVKKQRKIFNAINKYGFDNFKVEILFETDDDTNIYGILNQLEEDFINLYNSINNGYNLRSGGKNFKHSEESKILLSKKHKERLEDEKDKIWSKKTGINEDDDRFYEPDCIMSRNMFNDTGKLLSPNLFDYDIGYRD